MNKITTVKIGPFDYAVEYVPDLRDEHGRLAGRVRHGQSLIQIDAEMNQQATTQTILHEIVHTIASQIGMPAMKEELVDALATCIYQVIRENPPLVKMINGK